MQFLKSLFEVFSRRKPASAATPQPITSTFRNRVLLLCRDVIGPTGYMTEFWEQVHQKLEYLHGRPVLTPDGNPSSRSEDTLNFLMSCESDSFLDFVENIFRVDAFWRVSDKQGVVDQLNQFFDIDGLPYFLTDYLEAEEAGSHHGYPTTIIRVAAYPQVAIKEHSPTHSEAIIPALDLLSDPRFAAANSEFLDALYDYRHRDFGDCLTKCCSAYESVMKVLCDQNQWPYQQTDTPSTLVGTVVKNTGLDSFFTQPLMLVATMRNRLSKAHGAGIASKDVPQHIAQFAITSSAAGILLLVNAARNRS
jgi:hypothetical protein